MEAITRLADDIAASGLKYVFGITGSGQTLELADALENKGVEFVRTQFEGSAAMMAATTGRLTGHAGVAMSIKGPGLTNMVPGLAVASFENWPVVGICEAYGSTSSASRAHKRIDQIGLARHVSKTQHYLQGDGNGYLSIAKFAESEVPGPVVLQLSGAAESSSGEPDTPVRIDDDEALIEIVDKSDRPVVIAGSLAVRSDWSDLLEQLSVPVFSTVAAKGVLNEHASHSAGIFTGVGKSLAPEQSVLGEADLILGIGLRPTEVLSTRRYGSPGSKFVNIEYASAIPGTDGFQFDCVGSVGQMHSVFEVIASKHWGVDTVSAARRRLEDGLDTKQFLPWQAFRILEAELSSKGRLILDTGNFCTIAEHAWRSRCADEVLLSGQGRYMGTCIPMAIGASIQNPDMPHVAVVGDGGIGPFVGELRLAVEYKLPILLVLMTDGRFGSVATRALKDGLSINPLTMKDASWLRILDGFRIAGTRVDSAIALESAIRSWDATSGPAFIEIAFEPGAYERMVHDLR